jgi:hypothetical protein
VIASAAAPELIGFRGFKIDNDFIGVNEVDDLDSIGAGHDIGSEEDPPVLPRSVPRHAIFPIPQQPKESGDNRSMEHDIVVCAILVPPIEPFEHSIVDWELFNRCSVTSLYTCKGQPDAPLALERVREAL